MSNHIKSLTCPSGSTPTPSKLYCQSGDVIKSPEEYAGERVGTCGSNQSSAQGVPGFVIDGEQMKCIRDGLAAKGIVLPKEYFYFDILSNIEGYTCLNTSNVATNIKIAENGMDVVEGCLMQDGAESCLSQVNAASVDIVGSPLGVLSAVKDCRENKANSNVKVKAFEEFIELHTVPKHSYFAEIGVITLVFAIIAPITGFYIHHFLTKWHGLKGPPPAPPATPGVSAPRMSPFPGLGGQPTQFSVPENGFSDMYNPIPVFSPPPQSMLPENQPLPIFNPWPQSMLPGMSPAPATSPAISSSPSIGLRPPTEREAQAMGLVITGVGLILSIGVFLRNPAGALGIAGPKCLVASPGSGGLSQSNNSGGPI